MDNGNLEQISLAKAWSDANSEASEATTAWGIEFRSPEEGPGC